MNKRILLILKMVLTLVLPVAMASCSIKRDPDAEENLTQTQLGESTQSAMLKVDLNRYPLNKTVCDPLSASSTTSTSYEKGLKAQLFYRDTGMPRYYKTTDYIEKTKASNQTIFLSDLNVPTRMFTEGFVTPSGNVLQSDSEERLIEYFALKATSHLSLTVDDEEGDYELAMLSDDGSTLKVSGEMLINNDGDHPTRMGCATKITTLKKGDLLPIEMTYYQGPRYHISNVLIWRKASLAGLDLSCGKLGNHLYFNPDDQSKPQQGFKDLLARGWKIVKPDNFIISSTTTQVPNPDYNPCAQGTDPVISKFVIGEVVLQSVSFTWETDIAATSQLILTNQTTGGITVTTTDNVLRTKHSLQIDNLQIGTTYKVQAYSVSEDLGKAKSIEGEFTTQ
ncbi:MAG: PA14 domain-containing protein [Bdellovibrionota bacterium]